ncbi:uncharacterized protein [Nicotiana sylvestris]|uniref:uncharacterized protein n=1 Tax=Nicotiana sylvestris TaxID=4096 RepID=UPI00388C8F86
MGSTDETSNVTAIDSSSRMFLHPSDIPRIFLVHTPFSGTGFGGWKRSIIIFLFAKNKIDFVDGTCPKPAENSPHIKQWNRCNNMVISWLTSSLSSEIAESVQYSEIAERALDIASYFNKLKKLWDELRIMRSNKVNACACPIRAELLKEEEEDRVHQFLMGLNEIYVKVRSNILMMQPLPSLDNTYNILLQDGKKKKPGHLIDKCYKLHGFPPNFKFTKGKRIAANVTTECEFSNDSNPNSS